MRDFGKGLITAAKQEIVEQMSTRDLDELTDLILNKASVAFYDKVLEQRLKTIDAKGLINALARAERLGYEPSDVQEDEEASTLHSQPPPPAADSATAVAPQPAAPLYCGICFRRFPAQSACNYHTKMKICTRLPSTSGGFKYNCQNCGQGFTTPMGLKYVSQLFCAFHCSGEWEGGSLAPHPIPVTAPGACHFSFPTHAMLTTTCVAPHQPGVRRLRRPRHTRHYQQTPLRCCSYIANTRLPALDAISASIADIFAQDARCREACLYRRPRQAPPERSQ